MQPKPMDRQLHETLHLPTAMRLQLLNQHRFTSLLQQGRTHILIDQLTG